MKIKLDTQLHVGRNLNLSKIKSVKNPTDDTGKSKDVAKPYGGFWTSTYINKEEGSDFLKSYVMDGDWYILEPLEADIFVVETFSDINHLLSNYGRQNLIEQNTFIDFEKLSEKFDALHLKSSCFDYGSPVKNLILYGRTLEIHNSQHHPFHQWRTESTLWFTDKFASCVKVR
ncbi:hypothetical protein [Bacillus cereus]|uniref:Uncharacterized protein n=1 Tax=Bacillus cereus HuA3-9 TaxID=1053205 RepID=R8DEJ7_BACCE|nr:hypothetical protein [Bacillus cereus]EOO22283.1 hypothetical protein IGA_00702 [Bacillus cereus HuA3-9]